MRGLPVLLLVMACLFWFSGCGPGLMVNPQAPPLDIGFTPGSGDLRYSAEMHFLGENSRRSADSILRWEWEAGNWTRVDSTWACDIAFSNIKGSVDSRFLSFDYFDQPEGFNARYRQRGDVLERESMSIDEDDTAAKFPLRAGLSPLTLLQPGALVRHGESWTRRIERSGQDDAELKLPDFKMTLTYVGDTHFKGHECALIEFVMFSSIAIKDPGTKGRIQTRTQVGGKSKHTGQFYYDKLRRLILQVESESKNTSYYRDLDLNGNPQGKRERLVTYMTNLVRYIDE
jgi:hypothetical protein